MKKKLIIFQWKKLFKLQKSYNKKLTILYCVFEQLCSSREDTPIDIPDNFLNKSFAEMRAVNGIKYEKIFAIDIIWDKNLPLKGNFLLPDVCQLRSR